MYKKSLLPMIVDSYDSFTSVEKAIADYFLSNNEKADFSSKAMKDRDSGVSICKKIRI